MGDVEMVDEEVQPQLNNEEGKEEWDSFLSTDQQWQLTVDTIL